MGRNTLLKKNGASERKKQKKRVGLELHRIRIQETGGEADYRTPIQQYDMM